MPLFITRTIGLRIFLLLGFAVLTSSCSSTSEEIVDPNNKNVSLIYGYIEMREAKRTLNWLSFRRYRPSAQRYYAKIYDGLFYHIGVEHGSYQVEKFGSYGNRSNHGMIFTFGASGKNQTAIKIKKPGLYNVGTYKYVAEKDRRGNRTKFSFKKSKIPSEKELLTELLRSVKTNHSDYVHQIKWIENRLAKL